MGILGVPELHNLSIPSTKSGIFVYVVPFGLVIVVYHFVAFAVCSFGPEIAENL